MRARNLTGTLLLAAALMVLAVGCRKPQYVTPDHPMVPSQIPETTDPDQALSSTQAARTVAGFLGLSSGDVTAERSKETEIGYLIEAKVASRSGQDERVRIEVTGDMQLLRSCRWLDDPPEGEVTLSAEHAKLVAQVLFDRWFPTVPVNMARDAVQIEPTTFMVSWVARLAQDVYTGDRVMALISVVDGHPLYYEQYAAVERPDPGDIPVKVAQARETAERALKSSSHAGRKVAGVKAILILSAPHSHDDDPLWFVDYTFARPEGAEEPPYGVAVNAHTGEIETDLIEVFAVE